MERRSDGMSSFFEPRSIAVAGVSTDPDKLGSIIYANLLENKARGLLKASVYALNPARNRIGGQPCFPDVISLPETPELLIVAVPESQTASLIREAAGSGVKASIIVTAGYGEAGKVEVEQEIGRVAAKHGMRVLGPNTIGVVDTWSGVDSLFLRPTKRLPNGEQVVSMLKPLKGEIAVISQSGHLAEAVSEELAATGIGMRALVGTGNQLDVSVEDVIEYFADDAHTKVIAVYLEGVRDGRRFMEAAAYTTKRKPLVVFKVGKTDVGARAALTHTASLVGDYEVYKAAFRKAGIIEASSLQELMDFAVALLMLPRTSGKAAAIVTNAGGVGAIAADEAEKSGLEVRQLSEKARGQLRSRFGQAPFLANASLINPVDLTATAPTDDFVGIAEAVLRLPEVDVGMILPTHQTPAISPEVGERLSRAILSVRKPVCVCVVGNSPLAEELNREFVSKGIPSFTTPERAIRALAAAASYRGSSTVGSSPNLPAEPRLRFETKQGPLPPRDASALLKRYRIAEPKYVVVRSDGDAQKMRGVEFPVACKLLSPDLVHKTDVGGVVVGVKSIKEVQKTLARFRKVAQARGIRFGGLMVQEMVKNGVELILGGTRDSMFGPIVVVGPGGTYAELMGNHAIGIAPVTTTEAKGMLGQSKVSRILEGYRGGPRAGMERLARVISSFSSILTGQNSVEELEINPLMVTGSGVLAVDTRVIVRHPPRK